LLNVPKECIIYKHPVFDWLKPDIFLSKLCNQSFAGYAMMQIRKAKGLNKKILNPIAKERKNIGDFCYVIQGQGSIELNKWLIINQFDCKLCGLVNIAHMKDIYALFYDKEQKLHFHGVFSSDDAFDVCLSSVPKDMKPTAIMSFNKNGYSKYCKEYKEYWEWVNLRNDERYANTIQHGKNYDSKNMMHTFRLLNMAEEIALEKRVNTFRKDREYLIKIRKGDFLYTDLVAEANQKIGRINELYEKSDLQEKPDFNAVEDLLVKIRKEFYKG